MNYKKTVFSAVQPSGDITIGNYIGAIRQWINLQNEYTSIFSLADLHTITVRQDSKIFSETIYKTYALFLACGLDLNKCIFFIQSDVSAHSELSWILSCFTQFGELTRMHQFKDKSIRYESNINAGLFTYPCLMAADILLYNTELVPVGKDQKQHVELARDIAQRFNFVYGETFVLPEPLIPEVGAKIMALKNPQKKMSKSAIEEGIITLLDSPESILNKIKTSVTDSGNEIKFINNELTGINNLMTIYSCMTDKTLAQIEDEFRGIGYGKFKLRVAEAVIEKLSIIQNKYYDLIKNKDYLELCFKENKIKAQKTAGYILNQVKEKMGFVISS